MASKEESILYDFEVFKKVSNDLKTKVKIFHISRSAVNSDNSVFFITDDDEVYAFGHNKAGILGLGPSIPDPKSDPDYKLIEELCGKRVDQFFSFNYRLCMFALTEENVVYVWGSNYSNIETQSENISPKYLKPTKIDFFDDKNIVHLTGYPSNYFALSSNGEVFKWNDDCWKQSSGKNAIPSAIILSIEPNKERIKFIDSSIQLGLAITESGKLYCIGRSLLSGIYENNVHQMTSVEEQFKNKKILKIVMCINSLCVLTDHGHIHYSESFYPDFKFYRIESNVRFIDMYADENQLLCQTEECVYLYKINERLIQTNYINFFEFYLEEHKATNATIHINSYGFLSTKEYLIENSENSYLIRKDRFLYNKDYKLEKQFHCRKMIGKGKFGKVYSYVQNKNNKFCAIKKIWTGLSAPAQTFRELRFLEKMDCLFVAKLITAWIELQDTQGYTCIQMEHYQVNLKKIIEIKSIMLSGADRLSLNFFISIEMLKELTECIDYLHSFEKKYLQISDFMPGREKLPIDKQSILHRDIKPENIMISDGSDGRYLKLTDFGLTTILNGSDEVNAAGTDRYKAPEHNFGLHSDIYSLGKIAEDLIHEINTLIYQSSDSLEKMKCHLKTIKTTFEDMTASDPLKRPNCKNIFEILNKVSIKSQVLRSADLEEQKQFLETLDEKFFSDFLKTKLNSTEFKSNESIDIKLESEQMGSTISSGSVETIDGLQNVMHKLLGSANSGLTAGNMNSMLKEMVSCVLNKVQQEIPNLFNVLISKGFQYCESKIVINENRIESILKEWNNMLVSIKAMSFRLAMEKDFLETTPNDWTAIMFLKPSPNQTQDLPQVSTDFDTIDVSNGMSAIFDAVSSALFNSKDYSNMIRVLAFLRYFEFRDQFRQYCEIMCENYQDTLLKIITLPSNELKIKEDFKLRTTDVTEEKSAILAIHLAIQRIIYFSPENSNRFNKFSINPFTRNFINERIIADPIWLSHNGNDFLTVKPLTNEIDYTPEEFVPDPDLSPLFSDLADSEECVSAMGLKFFMNFFKQIGGHDIFPNNYTMIDEDLD